MKLYDQTTRRVATSHWYARPQACAAGQPRRNHCSPISSNGQCRSSTQSYGTYEKRWASPSTVAFDTGTRNVCGHGGPATCKISVSQGFHRVRWLQPPLSSLQIVDVAVSYSRTTNALCEALEIRQNVGRRAGGKKWRAQSAPPRILFPEQMAHFGVDITPWKSWTWPLPMALLHSQRNLDNGLALGGALRRMKEETATFC